MSRQIIVNEPRHRLWCAMRLGLGINAFSDCVGTVAVEDDKDYVLAAVVYNRYQEWDNGRRICEASIAALPGVNWATKRFIKAILVYPFEVLGVSMINVICTTGNKKAQRFNAKLGFRRAGTVRRGYDGKRNAIIYDMLPHEASKWLGYEPTAWREPLIKREVANG